MMDLRGEETEKVGGEVGKKDEEVKRKRLREKEIMLWGQGGAGEGGDCEGCDWVDPALG